MNITATTKQSLAGAGWFNLLLGIWLIISPFVLGFERNTSGMWSNIVVGALVVVLTLAGKAGERPFQWLTVPLGAWLFLSPFVFGFASKAFLFNNIILAFLVIAGGAANEEIHAARVSRAPRS